MVLKRIFLDLGTYQPVGSQIARTPLRGLCTFTLAPFIRRKLEA